MSRYRVVEDHRMPRKGNIEFANLAAVEWKTLNGLWRQSK
jgi:hypothetical protein